MSILTSTSFYTARLRVTPTPATLSETFAILSELKQFGTIATFVQDETTQSSTPSDPKQPNVKSKPYSVVYTTLAPRLQAIRSALGKDPSSRSVRFDVSANAVYPNPRDLDPYNVRGLLKRKPRPKAQTFACTLTLEEESKTHPERHVLGHTEQNDSFTVNRRDGFAWVLAKSSTPTGLIRGLLPETDKTANPPGAKKSEESSEITASSRNSVSGLQKEPVTSRGKPLSAFSLSKMYHQTLKEA